MIARTLTSLALLAALIIIPTATSAQTESADSPLEISADGTLEWDRTKQIFTANKNALAQQGDVSIFAKTITANYRETKDKDIDIHTLTATDNVIIDNTGSKAYGQKTVYDLDKNLATMTGDNLRMVSDDQTLVANDNFEYWTEEGRLVANGAAKITRLTDTLQADTITAYFTKNAAGKQVLSKMVANGHVIITTPTEVLTGNYGTYTAKTDLAEVTGNVKITRGPNVLKGAKAQINLTTNISRIFSGGSNNERVRGVFYPKSK